VSAVVQPVSARVTPIHDLLHRIQWDPEYAKASFEVGYWDRIERRIVRVPWARIHLGRGQFGLDAVEEDGRVHHVPLHRVRAVWRDGAPIWQRPLPGPLNP
jgi:uncharacterized protein (UPF0248 family)